jgi:hypothetical protein
MERGKARGRLSLRRAQLKMVEDGNATMGIWLGKNVLGQRDEITFGAGANACAILIMPQPLGMAAAESPAIEGGRRAIDVTSAPVGDSVVLGQDSSAESQ